MEGEKSLMMIRSLWDDFRRGTSGADDNTAIATRTAEWRRREDKLVYWFGELVGCVVSKRSRQLLVELTKKQLQLRALYLERGGAIFTVGGTLRKNGSVDIRPDATELRNDIERLSELYHKSLGSSEKHVEVALAVLNGSIHTSESLGATTSRKSARLSLGSMFGRLPRYTGRPRSSILRILNTPPFGRRLK